MSTENTDATESPLFCNICEVDLSKEKHKAECEIGQMETAKQFEEATLEKEKKKKESIAKATEKAKRELEEKEKKKADELAKKLEKDNAIIEKIIHKIAKRLGATFDEIKSQLEGATLPEVIKVYKLVIDQSLNPKDDSDTFLVSCPMCREKLGETKTLEEAQQVQIKHKKEKHSSSSNWLIFGLLFASLAGIAGYFAYQKTRTKTK